jgi:hypothetical protein
MKETSVVELLNPMSTFGNTTYDELAQSGYSGCRCGIVCSYSTNFSLTNPEYTSLTFLSYYPEFTSLLTGDAPPYLNLFETYYKMANRTLSVKRYGLYDWEFLMSSFIAHYMILTFQRLDAINTNVENNNIQQTLSALSNQSMGLAVKESLGGEEIQIENMINVSINKNAGQFMTTPYGRDFWDKYYSYARNFIRGVY